MRVHQHVACEYRTTVKVGPVGEQNNNLGNCGMTLTHEVQHQGMAFPWKGRHYHKLLRVGSPVTAGAALSKLSHVIYVAWGLE